ncbi:MMPL family transporter [Streptomyces sp. NPDC048603]|uniref:MMPL family transporter n=1 Tax=Streptomyces sp. NPDC048603 TaxID=3365577 RepID=UPI003723B214
MALTPPSTDQASPDRSAARPPAARPDRLSRLARRVVHRPVVVLVWVLLAVLAAGIGGADVRDRLALGGYTATDADSTTAERWLARHTSSATPQLLLLARSDAGPVDDPRVAAAGRALTAELAAVPEVASVGSYWTTGLPHLRSADRTAALIGVRLDGDENAATRAAARLAARFQGSHGPLTVTATGSGPTGAELLSHTRQDVERAELIGTPLTLLILVIALGSLCGALLPVAVGLVAVAGTQLVLRGMAGFTEVSVLTLDLTTTLGFGLAVDYSLLLVNRYREELAAGLTRDGAIVRAVRTAGRTILVSALTVALCSTAMLLFPLYFLTSMAWTAITVVLLAALTSVVVLPALLALLGHRLDALDPFARFRRSGSAARRHGSPGWHRLGTAVMRHPWRWGAAVLLLLAAGAAPAAQAHFVLSDDRVLPASSGVHRTAEEIRTDFDWRQLNPVLVVLPDAPTAGNDALTDYAVRLSRLPDVRRVDSAVGSWTSGLPAPETPAGRPALAAGAGSLLAVTAAADPDSRAAERLVGAVRELPAPAPALVGGATATLVDTKAALRDRLPWAVLIVAGSMTVLLFLYTGSLVIPLKAMFLAALSLATVLGVLVALFQDGRLHGLLGDFTVYHGLEVTTPTLVLFIAFGLSMDYEIFLLSRIQEEYRRTGDNSASVARGLERTGRLVTTAAVVLATLMTVLAFSPLTPVKLFAVGIALALLLDATVVRGILLPALMRVTGRLNWWAPAPLARLRGGRVTPEAHRSPE